MGKRKNQVQMLWEELCLVSCFVWTGFYFVDRATSIVVLLEGSMQLMTALLTPGLYEMMKSASRMIDVPDVPGEIVRSLEVLSR